MSMKVLCTLRHASSSTVTSSSDCGQLSWHNEGGRGGGGGFGGDGGGKGDGCMVMQQGRNAMCRPALSHLTWLSSCVARRRHIRYSYTPSTAVRPSTIEPQKYLKLVSLPTTHTHTVPVEWYPLRTTLQHLGENMRVVARIAPVCLGLLLVSHASHRLQLFFAPGGGQ